MTSTETASEPRSTAQAGRRPAELREAHRRRPRGVHRGRPLGLPGGHRPPGRGRDRHPLPPLPHVARLCSRRSTWRRWRPSAVRPSTWPSEPPWEALVAWLHRFVGYMATKQALAEELLAYTDPDADVFKTLPGQHVRRGRAACWSGPRRRRWSGPTPTSPRSSNWSAASPRSRRPTRPSWTGYSTWPSTASATGRWPEPLRRPVR